MIFVSYKPFNLKWTRTQYCLLPSISVSQGTNTENQNIQISPEESLLSLSFFTFATLGLTLLCCSECVAPMRNEVREKQVWKSETTLLRLWDYFNSSRGVIQGLNKSGGITLIINSCFCLPSPPSTLFGTIRHLQFYLLANFIFLLCLYNYVNVKSWCPSLVKSLI